MAITDSMSIILAVDDEHDAHFLLKRAFRQSETGIPLISLTNGDEAVEYLAGKKQYNDRTAFPLPSLLLLDLKMPGKNGFEVLEFIRENPELQDIPVVVFSCSDEKADVIRAYALGCHAYVRKAVGLNELVALVKAMTEEFFPDSRTDSDNTQLTRPFSSFIVPCGESGG
jgi:CheY-like chemotaxis protein